MALVTNLPLELLLSIIEYVCDEHYSGSAFASMNRSFSSRLLRKARRIVVDTRNYKWKSEELRKKLLGMIDDPYHQLFVTDNSRPAEVLAIATTLAEIGRMSSFIDVQGRVLVSTQLKSPSFKLKSFSILNCDSENFFDVIPSLESLHVRNCWFMFKMEKLNLPSYSLLRSFKLHGCYQACDVSCLDGIHDLELIDCASITDISCLNQNYRVKIKDCPNIITYSKSFRYARFLEVNDSRKNMDINLQNCLQLRSLSLAANSTEFSSGHSSSLLFLSLQGISTFEFLPPNRLQKVSIINCCNFSSFDNMNHIRSIHLEELDKITTLTGLGPKNQSITLNYMNKLEDIRSLKESQNVKIFYCPLLNTCDSLNCLASVKTLDIDQGPTLTSLDSLKELHQLVNLKDLKFTFSNILKPKLEKEYYESIRSLISSVFINIDKIVLWSNHIDVINDEIREQFMITWTPLFEVILIRKRK